MYFQLLSVALVVICAVASPSIKPSEITQQDVDIAIERISTELLNRFDEKRGWEPDGETTGWLSKGLGGTTAVATLALLSANQSQHTSIMKFALMQVGDGQIIFLDGDIRNALLGQPSWGVHGYDATTSAALMCVLAERIQ